MFGPNLEILLSQIYFKINPRFRVYLWFRLQVGGPLAGQDPLPDLLFHMTTPTYRSNLLADMSYYDNTYLQIQLLSAPRALAPMVHFSGPTDGPWTPPPGVQSQGAALPGVQSHSGVARDSWGAATRSSTSTITARARE